MGRGLMAPITDPTTRIASAVASPVTTHHAAKGSVFVDLRKAGDLKIRQLPEREPMSVILRRKESSRTWFRIEESGFRD